MVRDYILSLDISEKKAKLINLTNKPITLTEEFYYKVFTAEQLEALLMGETISVPNFTLKDLNYA